VQGSIASFGQIHEEFTAELNGIAVRVTRDELGDARVDHDESTVVPDQRRVEDG
jgi:hypothetical protein